MRQHDARLVPLAVGSVIGCVAGAHLVARYNGSGWMWLLIGVAVVAAVLPLIAVLWPGQRRGDRSPSRSDGPPRPLTLRHNRHGLVAAWSLLCIGVTVPLTALAPAASSSARTMTAAWAADALRAEATVRLTSHPREVGQGHAKTWVCQATTVTSRAQTSAKLLPAGVPLTVWGEQGCAAYHWQETVHLAGRLRASDTSAVAAEFSASASESVAVPSGFAAAANSLRSQLIALTSHRGNDGDQLVAGLVIGYDDGQSEALRQALKDSGLSHLSAVSGANITIVGGGAMVIATLVTRRRWLRAVASAATIAAYVHVVGPDPSVLRAATMGSIALAALVWDRTSLGLHGLSLAICLIAAWQPHVVLTLGFALSASATLGIVLLGPWLKCRWEPHVGEVVAGALSLTVAATVSTAPLLAAVDGQVSVVGVAANLVAGLFVAPITILGVVALACAPVSTGLAAALLWGASFGGLAIAKVAYAASSMPLATVSVGSGASAALVVIAVSLLVAAVIMLRGPRLRTPGAGVLVFRRFVYESRTRTKDLTSRVRNLRLLHRRVIVMAGVAAVIVALLVGPAVWERRGVVPGDWYAAACDVGQGSAYLARTGPQRAIAIDVGPNKAAFDRCLRQLDVHALDAVVVTHFHADHAEALPAVLADTPVGSLWLPATYEPRELAEQVVSAAHAAAVPTYVPETGTAVIGEHTVHFSAPSAPRCAQACTSAQVNDKSLVALVVQDDGTSLFTGDVEFEGGVRVARWLRDLAMPVDVLATPHHGSAAQVPALIHTARARVHLVSVGRDNDYGHPAPSALELLRNSGGGVWRTDLGGTLVVGASVVVELG